MNLLIIFVIILAILGIINTSYLIISRLKKRKLICPINQDCNKVVESKWSKIFYINNDYLGLLYYLFILIGVLYLNFVSENILFIMKIVSIISLSFSIFLFYIQARIIKSYCFYCILSLLINLFIFISIIILYK